MFRSWTKVARSASLLGLESHQVIALRLVKLAKGGEAAQKEAHRMVAEKIAAAQAAALKLAMGGQRARLCPITGKRSAQIEPSCAVAEGLRVAKINFTPSWVRHMRASSLRVSRRSPHAEPVNAPAFLFIAPPSVDGLAPRASFHQRVQLSYRNTAPCGCVFSLLAAASNQAERLFKLAFN